jgi:hypothetical protein
MARSLLALAASLTRVHIDPASSLPRLSLAALLTLLSCAGDERDPLPYYGVPAAVGGAAGASGSSGQPGAAGAPASAVVLNEIDPSGEPADWVELVNRGPDPVDLSGWSVVQGDGASPVDDADRQRLPAGTALAPGAYLRVFTKPPDGPGPGDFGISKSADDRISLLDAADAVVDSTALDGSASAPLAAGTSWARLPDATGDFARAASTPGAPNAP